MTNSTNKESRVLHDLKAIRRCLKDLDDGEQPHIVHYAILNILAEELNK